MLNREREGDRKIGLGAGLVAVGALAVLPHIIPSTGENGSAKTLTTQEPTPMVRYVLAMTTPYLQNEHVLFAGGIQATPTPEPGTNLLHDQAKGGLLNQEQSSTTGIALLGITLGAVALSATGLVAYRRSR